MYSIVPTKFLKQFFFFLNRQSSITRSSSITPVLYENIFVYFSGSSTHLQSHILLLPKILTKPLKILEPKVIKAIISTINRPER